MRLVSAQVKNFKSITDTGVVAIERSVTVLVGQNEAGKTAFLQALYKAKPADDGDGFDREMDYPRGSLNLYEETHEGEEAEVVELKYELSEQEEERINAAFGAPVVASREFTVHHYYGDKKTIGIRANEAAFVKSLLEKTGIKEPDVGALRAHDSAKALLAGLAPATRSEDAEALFQDLNSRFGKMPSGWKGADFEIWKTHIEKMIPPFLYFDDYRLLPGRMNLAGLQQRVANATSMTDQDRAVLGLLRMARVDLGELVGATTYEGIVAKLEAFSNTVTDRVFKYWKQNDQLEVRIDVRLTPGEQPPFNNGPNLEIRIYNKRHRVTVGFDQRSRGFIWFFSFLVWFDSVKKQLGTDADLVLLLDEPGLSLHAMAQADFLAYIDDLARAHQTIYTTHSPFMVRSDRLHEVRVVEDRKDRGTVVSDNVSGSDPKTLFPLQAALGYTIAQNLFISKRNLLVEGPADLVYLQQASAALEAMGRTTLRDDITIVPAGGLDNVGTFVALLGANALDLAVLHDYAGKPDQRLEHLKREKLLKEPVLLNYAMFRSGDSEKSVSPAEKKPAKGAKASAGEDDLKSSDVEDMFEEATYVGLFNATYARELGGKAITASDLPKGDRIIERINRFLDEHGIKLRPSGGFNHYRVANHLAANPLKEWDAPCLDRFEALFKRVNGLFGSTKDDRA